jgi:hypothetical protein
MLAIVACALRHPGGTPGPAIERALWDTYPSAECRIGTLPATPEPRPSAQVWIASGGDLLRARGCSRPVMHVVIRHYEGNSKLIDELVGRRKDVEALIREVDGFVAYYLIRTAGGDASISVFENEAGTTESTKQAAAFIKENLPAVASGPPQIIEGQTVIDFR